MKAAEAEPEHEDLQLRGHRERDGAEDEEGCAEDSEAAAGCGARCDQSAPVEQEPGAGDRQITSQYSCKAGSEDKAVAIEPMMPDEMPADPGTASDAAASIDARM
jgi:hypothetical protein